MKKTLILLTLLAFLWPLSLLAQEDYPKGSPIGRIFADYRYSINSDDEYSGFGVSRAWLGYKFSIDENFSAQIIVDIGSPLGNEDVSAKRYMFIRNALVSYNKDRLTLSFGVCDERASQTELKLWGKRYLSSPFLLQYKFANIADIGFIADYKVSDILSLDAAILNGEGYTQIETDNSLKYAFGITITPIRGLIIRGYGDTNKREEGTKNTLSASLGFVNEKFSLAAGYNYKSDFDWTDGHNTGGFTVFGGFNLSAKLELFGRFDRLRSQTPDGESEPWNLSKDGSLFITGVQYKVMKQLKFSVNYQGWNAADPGDNGWNYIQANAEFRF